MKDQEHFIFCFHEHFNVTSPNNEYKVGDGKANIASVISHLPSAARSDNSDLWLTQDESDPQESKLGLHWHCASDTLSYKHRNIDCSVATMRNIRLLASQYDPLGYIVPYTTRAKVLVQRLWTKKGEWDDTQLPEGLVQAWRIWEKELQDLQKIMLPRCYTSSEMDEISTSSVMPRSLPTAVWLI